MKQKGLGSVQTTMEDGYVTFEDAGDSDGIYTKKDRYMEDEVLVLVIDGIGYELGPPTIFSSDNSFKLQKRLYATE